MSSFIHPRSSCIQEETQASPFFECLSRYFLSIHWHHALWCHHIHECKSHHIHLATQLMRSSWAPTISLDSHQNIRLHTGTRVNVMLCYLLTYLEQILQRLDLLMHVQLCIIWRPKQIQWKKINIICIDNQWTDRPRLSAHNLLGPVEWAHFINCMYNFDFLFALQQTNTYSSWLKIKKQTKNNYNLLAKCAQKPKVQQFRPIFKISNNFNFSRKLQENPVFCLTIPWNVENDDTLEVRESNELAIAFQSDSLFQVFVSLIDDLSPAEHAVPHHVLRPTLTLFRVFFPLYVEVECDLSIQPDAEIVVHHASLFKVIARGWRINNVRLRGSTTKIG